MDPVGVSGWMAVDRLSVLSALLLDTPSGVVETSDGEMMK
jgi:hypothetical protein